MDFEIYVQICLVLSYCFLILPHSSSLSALSLVSCFLLISSQSFWKSSYYFFNMLDMLCFLLSKLMFKKMTNDFVCKGSAVILVWFSFSQKLPWNRHTVTQSRHCLLYESEGREITFITLCFSELLLLFCTSWMMTICDIIR